MPKDEELSPSLRQSFVFGVLCSFSGLLLSVVTISLMMGLDYPLGQSNYRLCRGMSTPKSSDADNIYINDAQGAFSDSS